MLRLGWSLEAISTTNPPSFSPRSHLLTENEQKDFKFLCIFLVTFTCPKTRRIFFYLRKFLRYDLPVSSPFFECKNSFFFFFSLSPRPGGFFKKLEKKGGGGNLL